MEKEWGRCSGRRNCVPRAHGTTEVDRTWTYSPLGAQGKNCCAKHPVTHDLTPAWLRRQKVTADWHEHHGQGPWAKTWTGGSLCGPTGSGQVEDMEETQGLQYPWELGEDLGSRGRPLDPEQAEGENRTHVSSPQIPGKMPAECLKMRPG